MRERERERERVLHLAARDSRRRSPHRRRQKGNLAKEARDARECANAPAPIEAAGQIRDRDDRHPGRGDRGSPRRAAGRRNSRHALEPQITPADRLRAATQRGRRRRGRWRRGPRGDDRAVRRRVRRPGIAGRDRGRRGLIIARRLKQRRNSLSRRRHATTRGHRKCGGGRRERRTRRAHPCTARLERGLQHGCIRRDGRGRPGLRRQQ